MYFSPLPIVQTSHVYAGNAGETLKHQEEREIRQSRARQARKDKNSRRQQRQQQGQEKQGQEKKCQEKENQEKECQEKECQEKQRPEKQGGCCSSFVAGVRHMFSRARKSDKKLLPENNRAAGYRGPDNSTLATDLALSVALGLI